MTDEVSQEQLFLEELHKILQARPVLPKKEHEFRVYYDSDGNVITYTTEDLPGNYLVITKEQFNLARHDAKIRNGKLILVHLATGVIKLYRKDTGHWRVLKQDLSIVADEDDHDDDIQRCSFETFMKENDD
jgi:hypothetical protein